MREHPIFRYAADHQVTLAAIAERARCSRMTLYRVITGKQNATIDLLKRISAATDGQVSVSEFLASNVRESV